MSVIKISLFLLIFLLSFSTIEKLHADPEMSFLFKEYISDALKEDVDLALIYKNIDRVKLKKTFEKKKLMKYYRRASRVIDGFSEHVSDDEIHWGLNITEKVYHELLTDIGFENFIVLQYSKKIEKENAKEKDKKEKLQLKKPQ